MNYTSTFVRSGFHLALWSRLTRWSAKTNEKWSFSGIFSRLPHVFGQVKEWFLLELLEMMKASHLVACSIVFVWLCNLGGMGECSKLREMVNFKNFLSFEFCSRVFGHFKVWVTLKSAIVINLVLLMWSPIIFMSIILASKKQCFSLSKMVLF